MEGVSPTGLTTAIRAIHRDTRCCSPHPDDLALVRDPRDHQRRQTRKHHAHKLVRTQHLHMITDSRSVTTECETEPNVCETEPSP